MDEKENINKLPIIQNIKRLKQDKRDLRNEFNQTNKDMRKIQIEMNALENEMEKNNEFEIRYLLEEISRIETEMNFMDEKDQEENKFLRKQLNNLLNDQFKIKQNTMFLEERVYRANEQIGFITN